MTLSLTNPGLAEDQGQGIDPASGAPVQLPPIVRYFKNAALRGHQAALDEMSTVQPGTSNITGPNGGAPQIPESGQPDTTQVSQNAPPPSSMPKMFKPSFAQTTTDAQGLQAPINPAQSKLGKLVTILAAAGKGALAGWGTGGPAAGAAAAREIPFQQAEQHQQLAQQQAQLQLTRMQSQMVPTPYGPMPAGMAKVVFPAAIRAGATTGAAQIGATAKESAAQTGAQSREAVAGTNKRFIPVPNVGLVDTQDPNGPSLVPNTQNGIVITPEIAADHNLPAQFIGKPMSLPQLVSMAPKASTTSSSSSTDLMGNTRETNQRVTAPVLSPGGGGVRPVNMAQRTTGGPLTAKTGAGGPARPPVGGTSPAASQSQISLPPDVEQRLASSGLSAQEQQYARGLLGYRGQMPSPRAKNYAATLATLTSLDPNFNAANYDANKKTFEDYSPGGSIGKQAIAFNTAISHLNMLDQAATALKSGQAPALNKVAQYFKVQTGDSAVTTFNNIADAVDGEVSKTFKGTATEGELSRVGAHFNSALGPAQIQNNVRSTIALLNGKMGEMQSAYQRQVGRPINMVSPEAQSAIQRMTPPSHEVYAPDGKTLIGHVVANKYVPMQ